MNTFIETTDGAIAWSRVVRIGNYADDPKQDNRRWIDYVDEHGDGQRTRGYVNMQELCSHVVPAAPGFYAVLGIDGAQSVADMCLDPIVAWGIVDNGRNAYAFSPEGSLLDQRYAVLDPSGRVMEPFGASYNSLQAYFEAERSGDDQAVAAEHRERSPGKQADLC